MQVFTKYPTLEDRVKYLRNTLVFMWNSALREKLNYYFQGVYC